MSKLILLDRDGTLIINKHYLNDPNDIEYLDGVEKALGLLASKGFRFAVVTNQSGIPRGKVTEENMHKIHDKMKKHFENHGIKLEKFYFSPHLPESEHPTRKPNPGMLLQAIEDLGGDPKASWMIGDKMIDVEAGHRAGMTSALIGLESGEYLQEWRKPKVQAEHWDELVKKILEKI